MSTFSKLHAIARCKVPSERELKNYTNRTLLGNIQQRKEISWAHKIIS